MKEINGFVVKNSNDHVVLDFGKSCNLIKLSFNCRENTKIMYVQNAVIDSPIPLGETITVKQGIQELLLARAVPAFRCVPWGDPAVSQQETPHASRIPQVPSMPEPQNPAFP